MRKITILTLFFILLLVFQATALSATEAEQDWIEAKQANLEASEKYNQAQQTYEQDKTPENDQAAIDAGKELLHAALNEVEAWLIWTDVEAKENLDVPQDLQETISQDVEKNLAEIEPLRNEIDDIDNRIEFAIVYLKMVNKYLHLLTDVARNNGLVWVHIATLYADSIEEYSNTIEENAKGNSQVLAQIELVDNSLADARFDITNAQGAYTLVLLPGAPLLKYADGNAHLYLARNDLIAAYGHLSKAYILMAAGGK
jgi:hypothetical protein